MDNTLANGLSHGRPHGGVAVLWRKSLSSLLSFYKFDINRRIVCVKLSCDTYNLLCFSCFFLLMITVTVILMQLMICLVLSIPSMRLILVLRCVLWMIQILSVVISMKVPFILGFCLST